MQQEIIKFSLFHLLRAFYLFFFTDNQILEQNQVLYALAMPN